MISVIVPVFNAENTLEHAISSIQSSLYGEIEIIIIDDGSTDSTPVICDRFSKVNNIRVFHTENHGVSAARNIGLREARGDYIGFVDGDDWTEPDMYQKLLQTMEDQQADLVACGIINETAEGSYAEDCDGSIVVSEGDTIYQNIILSSGIRGYLWNKLFRKELISCGFDETIEQCEDLLFTAQYCEHVRKAVYLNESLYHYTRKPVIDSYTYTKRSLSLMDAYEEVYSLYQIKASEYAYLPEQNALKTYLHFRARAKILKEKKTALLSKINNGISMHFANVLKENKVSLKTKGNICFTYLFPRTALRMKRRVLACRHRRGQWEL